MAIVRCVHHLRRHLSLPALFLLLLVLPRLLSTAKKQEKISSDDADMTGSALVDWIRASGGHSDVHIGFVVDAPPGAELTSTKTLNEAKKKTRKRRGGKKEGSSALRGTIAIRDIAAGDVIIRLPSNISVPLGGTGVTSPENVVLLFARRAADPAWFRELAPYWDSLPLSVFTKEMYEPEHMELLQDEGLAKLARNEVSWIQRVYSGETMQGRTPSLDEACAGGSTTVARPTLEEFRHLTAVVASYAFHLPDDEGTDRTVMLPLLDLVNHANAGVANAIVAREGEDFTARALRDIREGEEVTHMYSHGNARNDHTVLHYGFLDRSRWEQPQVCCSDLDGADLWNCGVVDRNSRELGSAERDALKERYSKKLAAFSTSVRDDESILAGIRDETAWKTRLLIEFRLLRKRALQQAIDKLRTMPEVERNEL